MDFEQIKGTKHPQFDPSTSKPQEYIKAVLKHDLPASEKQGVEESSKWHFVLDNRFSKSKKSKKTAKKKQYLTRNQRRKLNLLKLPKQNWKYEDLQPMRDLWKQYMRNNLNIVKSIPSPQDAAWISFNSTLTKSEFAGSEITVIRSTAPSVVGISGTVVLETKCTFNIVTPKSEYKCLLKKPSVFCLELDNIKFTIFGKHMLIKPSERTTKKVKLQMLPDL